MSNYNIKVSIITPSYNQAAYLEETIQSVLNQSYKNIEYIIIDGGSTDASIEIIEQYDTKLAYWVSEKDKGQADAINKGFRKASGDLVCWINSDDILYPRFVERRVKEFRQNPEVDFIYGDVDQGKDFRNKRLRKGKRINKKELIRDIEVPIPQQSAIWRKEVFDKIGFLDEKWDVLLDRDFFTRMVLKCNIKYFPYSVAFFRNHELSKSVAQNLKWVSELPIYYEELFKKPFLPEYYKKLRKQSLINTYLLCAGLCIESKDYLRAKEFNNKARKISLYFYFLVSVRNLFIKRLINKFGFLR